MRRTAALFALFVAAAPLGRADAAMTIYPRVGSQSDSTITPAGPGLVVMGGGSDVDRAFVWMHDTVVGSASATGADVVVLRATGDNAYDAYIAGLAPFNSVQTLLIPTPASASDLATAAAIVDKAEVVFFAGGNQADYVGWKGSPLMTAVAGCQQRGGVVGGTSAGAAILGQFVYDSIAAGSNNVTTADAVANPYEPAISFTRDLFHFPSLVAAITDPHFAVRDRFGRLAVFMARQLADGAASGTIHGIGVDEGAALCIDKHGLAVLEQFTAGTGAAFIVTAGPAAAIHAGQPLRYPGLTVTRLDQQGQTYDVAHWCGTTTTYDVDVDGTMSPVYVPANPYTAAGVPGMCSAATPPDLGVAPDGGGIDVVDGGAPSDLGGGGDVVDGGAGGSGGGGAHGDGGAHGCGCRVGGAGGAGGATPGVVVAMVAALWLARQRRRRS